MLEGAATSSAAPAPTPVNAVVTEGSAVRINKVCRGTTRGSLIILERDRKSGGNPEKSFKTHGELVHSVDTVDEAHRALRLEAEVPGFESKDLGVALKPRRFSISGKRETIEEPHSRKTVHQKPGSNESCRVIPWPVQGDGRRVE